MSELVLGEIKGKNEPLLFTIPKIGNSVYAVWDMLDAICNHGEVVALTVTTDLMGTQRTELKWPVTKDCLRNILTPEHIIQTISEEQIKSTHIRSYHSVLGEFFIAENNQPESIKTGMTRKQIKNRTILCLNLNVLGKSFSLGWRN